MGGTVPWEETLRNCVPQEIRLHLARQDGLHRYSIYDRPVVFMMYQCYTLEH